jgi:hypothetical protein
MSTAAFIEDLVALLVRFDRGMLEFEEPPPHEAGQGLADAVIAFADAAVPALHAALTDGWSSGGVGPLLIDVLGEIGHASSVPYLIEHHRSHADYMSGTVAMQALRKLRSNEGYEYMAEMLARTAEGDWTAINTGHEVVVACMALAEWDDPRAIGALVQATKIRGGFGMPAAAVEALAQRAEGLRLLPDLAERDPAVREALDRLYASTADD